MEDGEGVAVTPVEKGVAAVAVGTGVGRGVAVGFEPQATSIKAKGTSTPMTADSPSLRATVTDPLRPLQAVLLRFNRYAARMPDRKQ